MLPDPVNHDARCERILRTSNPFGQRETTPASWKLTISIRFERSRFCFTHESVWKPRLYRVARMKVVATNQDMRDWEARSGWRARNVGSNKRLIAPAVLAPLEDLK